MTQTREWLLQDQSEEGKYIQTLKNNTEQQRARYSELEEMNLQEEQ